MGKKRFTDEQIVRALRQAEGGEKVGQICQQLSFIESFNGRLRDECLNVEIFFTLKDARTKLALWKQGYNQKRPHSSLNDQAPAAVATSWATVTE